MSKNGKLPKGALTSRVLHLDYETRSRVNLYRDGAYNYAEDLSTEIICLGYAFNADEPKLWRPGELFPANVLQHMKAGKTATLHAHNAQFERLITEFVLVKYLDRPEIPIEAWYCTAAQARARALPGSLDDLGACLGLGLQKDRRGRELIKQLCIPTPAEDGSMAFNQDPDLLDELYLYCLQDVRVERLASHHTPPLTVAEHWDWVVSERVNDNGIGVDTTFAAAATEYAEAELEEIKSALTEITDGVITSPRQHIRLKTMMAPLIAESPEIEKAVTVVRTDRRTGEESRKISLDREARAKLLQLEELTPGTLPVSVVEVIELVDEAGRSSVSKYEAMTHRASRDGRVRGAYIYAGAGQTGRYSSVGRQVHNLPRRCAENPEVIRHKVLKGKPLQGGVLDTLSSMLRPSIVANRKNVLVWGDWSSIEARVLPWLSYAPGSTSVLRVFEQNDKDENRPDIYEVAAAGLFKTDAITSKMRSVGKVVVLSAGYQGGYRAFQAMARAYQVSVSDDEAREIIHAWRFNNPWAPEFWAELEIAAKDAVVNRGQAVSAGRVIYFRPERKKAPLFCGLPSGRVLSYPDPRLEEGELTAIKAQWKPRQGEQEWGRISLYGGLLAENVTQATAADILRHAMSLSLQYDWPVIGSTHDEIIWEVEKEEEAEARLAISEVMLATPEWAEGLPMSVDVNCGHRYHK